MGIGALGGPDLVFKRKFRWTFALENICGIGNKRVPESFVKVAARPNLSIEETEINFLNAKMWIPGKASWETITVTYIDIAGTANMPLYDWLATVYDFTNPTTLAMGVNKRAYSAEGILKMYDGAASVLETWTLQNVWPQTINFGELDYSSSEEATIELTLRYSDVKYEAGECGRNIIPCSPGQCG